MQEFELTIGEFRLMLYHFVIIGFLGLNVVFICVLLWEGVGKRYRSEKKKKIETNVQVWFDETDKEIGN